MIDSVIPLPAFTDNYIWAISSSSGDRVCVVDPGDAEPVIRYLNARNLTLSDIFITHHHPDHTGGLPELTAKYSPRVIGPGASNIKGITHYVADGDQIELYGATFVIMAVPGHTLDHIVFFHSGSDAIPPMLFCGDTLFAAGCGRLFEGTPQQMHASLAKLASLPPNTEVYCTHEYTLANLRFALAADPANELLQQRLVAEKIKREHARPTLPSSIKLELETNPFLRCHNPALVRSAAAASSKSLTSEIDVFAALRAWKDRF